MDWKPLGKVLFVLSALPWAVFIFTVMNLDALGLTMDNLWVIGELFVAAVMMVLGLWLANRD